MRKIFVTGIGTDVGKTIVSAILTEALKADYWKPVQCGTSVFDSDKLTDSEIVGRLISNSVSDIHHEAYCFKDAVSPHLAAELAGERIELSHLGLPETSNPAIVIEGAGGLLVPLNDREVVGDLISYLGASVVLVSSFYLGSINHTLLSCAELKRRNIPVLGIVFCGEYNRDSAEVIEKISELNVLGVVGKEKKIDKLVIKKYAEAFAKAL